MGLLKEKQEPQGLTGKQRGHTFFDRIVRWRKAKPHKGKYQKALERELWGYWREAKKHIRKGISALGKA